MLARARIAMEEGQDEIFDSISGKLADAEPVSRENRLDGVRVALTILMVFALFAIVAVVVSETKPQTTSFQFVSLASGLAGIGIGWLFGAGTSRKK